MAISTYAELQAAITDWMARSNLSGNAADFITLAEARLNRMLGPVATETTISALAGVTSVSTAGLSIIKPVSLYKIVDGSDDEFITPRALGSFTMSEVSGSPTIWATATNALKFDRPLDEDYDFRFFYEGRFALSDAAPTNEFLTDHPDLYLAASIAWGGVYIEDQTKIAMWSAMLEQFTAEVKSNIAQRKRGLLIVDPGLASARRYSINSDAG